MRKSIYFLLAIFSLTSVFTSCFDDDETDYTEYNDCAITAFALKDIEWEDTVPDQYGEDSIYTASVTASDYSFSIDHSKGLIYNADSLPKGTNLKKVLVSLTADGNVYYHRPGDDDNWYYLNQDSIDFTNEVKATVYSYSGTFTKEYTIRVNVHQQNADSTQWNQLAGAWIGKDLKTPKAVTFGEQVAVYGMQNGKLMVTTAPLGTMDWTEPEEVVGISETAEYTSIICFQNALYLVDQEALYVSDDAVSWTQMQTNTPIQQLLGCNNTQIFGVYDNIFITSIDALSWNKEATEYPALIPDNNVFSYHAPYSTNLNLERTVSFGQITESTDTIASAWYRESGGIGGYSDLWAYTYSSRDNKYALPNLDNLVVLYYKEYLIAFGNNCRNKGYIRSFDKLYVSKDWGLTWKGQSDENYDTYLELPSALYRNEKEFAAYVDKSYNLWILFTGNGDAWYGWLNKMKFERLDK